MVISYMINQTTRTFRKNWKKDQYRACQAIIGGIQGTTRERRYDGLGLHLLVKRRWD